MNEPSLETIEPRPASNSSALGCVLLIAAWIVGLAFLIYPIVWLVEQFSLAGGGMAGRGLWSGAVAGHAGATLLTCALGLALMQNRLYRPILRVWMAAGLFALLVLPVQLVHPPAAQAAALLQIAGALAYLLVLARLGQRAEIEPAAGRGPLWPAILAATLVIWPWFLWGALGSWLDTALNLAAAAAFGLVAGRTFHYLLATRAKDNPDAQPPSLGLLGLVIGVALLTMGAAYGYNGQQIILLGLLSVIGWLVAAVSSRGVGDTRHYDWRAAALLTGLVVAAPLLFVDPDELGFILNLGSRDVLFFTLRSVGVGALMILLLTIPALLATHRAGGEGRRITMGVAAAALIMLGVLYFLVGQPGLEGDRLYVIMANQADLSAAADIADPLARRAFVYATLVSHADDTQAEIRRTLDRAGIDYTPYYLVNALEVDGGPLARWWLATRPEVDRVLDSPELRPLPELNLGGPGTAEAPASPQWNLVDIGVTRVWEEFGVHGAGVIIGQSDSGVDGEHPEFRDQYRGDEHGAMPGDSYNWFDPWYGSDHPVDYGGHGTHTLGTVLGRTVGVAPEASWIGCVNLGRNLGNPPRYLDCLQFMLAPFPLGGDPLHDGRPDLGANVLNNSWGCPEIEGCDPNSLLPAVRALRAAGVFVVASAGNDGDACSTINAPISLYDDVFTIGATDVYGQIAPFSSRGPVTADGSGRTKPDIVAPGVDILSSYPDGTYEFNSGTSMAGPHVAGVVALLWSADPSLVGDIDRTEAILVKTATPVTASYDGIYCGDMSERPNNTVGYGLVDAFAAVSQLLAEKVK